METFNTSMQRQKQVDLCALTANVVYKVASSKPARAIS